MGDGVGGSAFADTSALLAVASSQDQYHMRACAAAERHIAAGGIFVSTHLVLGELHALLLRRAGGPTARRVVAALLDDPVYRWEDLPAGLVRDAVANWIGRFEDQRFTLVDAVSFEIMRRRKIAFAFAFDLHFTVAGFRVLA